MNRLMEYEEMLSPFEKAAQAAYEEAFNLLSDKHHDYGPHNISRSPGGPLMGLAVRLHDKVNRLANLVGQGKLATPANESLRDTLVDICNYGVIGVMVVDGKWPGA